MTTANKSEKDRVIIFDTTLRDGEQCPGATMTFEEKIEVAEMLDDMGVDVIEAGFPITSEGDFQAVSEIARRSKNAVIAGLSRANPKDIDRCAEAVKFARRGRVHTVIATSPLHMRVKLNMTPEQVMELSIANVTRARNQIDDVEWSAEDATRSEMDYLCRIVEAVIKAGATTVNIPDTVGYTTPEEYERFMRTLIERVPNSDKAVFSVHCHNDLGMGVANSLAGIAGGARQVECTVNGIGERAGNAALEEIVMAINVRNDKFPWWNKIDTTQLTRASKLVSAATSFPVQYNKAIVGRNAFAHESGIHQDGVLKDASTYEIMKPEMVGLKQSSLVLGKHSGRHAFVHKLEEMGYKLGAEPAGRRLRADEGARRPQEGHLRRGHRGAGRRGDGGLARSHQADLADGHRRHPRPAARHHEAQYRRPDQDRGGRRQRSGRRSVQLHQGAGAARGQARTVSGACGDRRHRRAGRSLGAAQP